MTAGQPRLLLHTCCAVCSTVALERLAAAHRMTLYYYNPNIHPQAEHDRRLAETRRYAAELGVELVAEPFTPDDFHAAIRGLEHLGERSGRCRACFRLRLEATARHAATHGFDVIASTLTSSRFKRSADVHAAGEAAAAAHGVAHLAVDLKKQGGVERARALADAHALYRQDYCGCVHSLRERAARVGR